MMNMRFDHTEWSKTSRYWLSLPDEDSITQRFHGYFMSHQLYKITAWNGNIPLLGSFQYGVTVSLSTGNLIVRNTVSEIYPYGLGIWNWQIFRGQGNDSLQIATFYRPVNPALGYGSGSVYEQHLNFLNSIKIRICTIKALIMDLEEKIDKCTKEGDLILLLGDFND